MCKPITGTACRTSGQLCAWWQQPEEDNKANPLSWPHHKDPCYSCSGAVEWLFLWSVTGLTGLERWILHPGTTHFRSDSTCSCSVRWYVSNNSVFSWVQSCVQYIFPKQLGFSLLSLFSMYQWRGKQKNVLHSSWKSRGKQRKLPSLAAP